MLDLHAGGSSHVTTRSVLLVRAFVNAASEVGVDVAAVLAELDVDPALLERDDARLETTLSNRIVMRLGDRAPQDVALALVAASRMELGQLGIFDHLVAAAGTLREAAMLASGFLRLLDETVELNLVEEGNLASFAMIRRASPMPVPALVEFALAWVARSVCELTGRVLAASEVQFNHRCKGDARAYEELFRAPVVFGAQCTEIAFPRAYLGLQLPRGSAVVRSALTQHATEMLAQQPPPMSFADIVRQHASLALASGDASLKAVAQRLGTSARTLQRKLHHHDTSYEALLDDARREIALSLVGAVDMPILEVARRVGFSDGGAFARAFRRWTTKTPRAFRASFSASSPASSP